MCKCLSSFSNESITVIGNCYNSQGKVHSKKNYPYYLPGAGLTGAGLGAAVLGTTVDGVDGGVTGVVVAIWSGGCGKHPQKLHVMHPQNNRQKFPMP